MGNKKIYAMRKQLYITPETDSDLDFLGKQMGGISRSRVVRQLVADEMARVITVGRSAIAKTRRRVSVR